MVIPAQRPYAPLRSRERAEFTHMDVERELDELFARTPEEFVAARDALAKRLKQAGDDDAAGTVKGLRRPTVAAWAINRLSREGADLDALLELARDLRKAQRGALSGLRGSALREGIKRRRAVVDRLADQAVEILDRAGRNGQTQREAISRTLEAATADADAAEAVRRGRVERELARPSGFGDVVGLVSVSSGTDGEEAEEGDGDGAAARRPRTPPKQDPRLRRLRTQRDDAADEARAAAQAAVRAGERAVQAESEAEEARAEIERMERDLRAARRREREASQAAVDAAAAVKKAEAAAERARKRVEDLQARLEKLLES